MFFQRYAPKLEDIVITAEELSSPQREGASIAWLNKDRVAIRISLGTSANWNFDCRQLDAAHSFYENMARDLKGVLLDLECRKIQGMEALVGVFKYRAPIPKSMAMYYVGIVWLPFRKFTFQINFEAVERGTTGVREAAVAMLEPQAMLPAKSLTQMEPVVCDSMEEMFEHMRSQPLQRIPSDDAKWDKEFPEHPLSQIRMLLARFESNSSFNPKLLKQTPYRVAG